MNLGKRLSSETPPFFKRVRLAGIVLVAAAGAILTAPVALPAALVAAAGYIATAGAVAASVAQAVVKAEGEE